MAETMCYGEKVVEVGTWTETESREETRCPGYYAADFETLRTRPGQYPVRVVFVGGYMVPMPYWVVFGIAADRIAGRTYNGFGGVNYSSQELPQEPKTLVVQTYVYQLKDLVATGKLVMKPEYAYLLGEKPWDAPEAPKTMADVK